VRFLFITSIYVPVLVLLVLVSSTCVPVMSTVASVSGAAVSHVLDQLSSTLLERQGGADAEGINVAVGQNNIAETSEQMSL
jgi:uncharacterized circularly permuted ATP-grasp superfamily protein